MSNSIQYAGTFYRSLMAAARAWAIDALPDTDVLDHDNARGSTEIARIIMAERARVVGDDHESSPAGVGRADWSDACLEALADRVHDALGR